MDINTGRLCGDGRHKEFACGCDASNQLGRQQGEGVTWVLGWGKEAPCPSPSPTFPLAKPSLQSYCKLSNNMLAVSSKGFAPNSCEGVTFHQKLTPAF